MTIEPTIAHGGTRRGDFLQVSPAEMHTCHRLIDMEHRLIALVAACELIAPGGAIPLAALKGAMAGAPC